MADPKPSTFHAFAVSEKCLVDVVSELNDNKKGPKGKCLYMNEKFSNESKFYADPIVKRTVIEMHQVFEECRQQVAANGKLTVEETRAFSLRYRSVLQSAAMNGENRKSRLDFVAWSLFESLFFSPSDSSVSLDLIRWAVSSFIDTQAVLGDVIRQAEEEGKSVEDTDNYWKAAVLQLTSFRFDMCARLLADNSCQDEATETFVAVLHRMDIQWLLDRGEISSYTTWQNAVRELIQAGTFDANPNIRFLAGIIVGEPKVFARLCEAIVEEWWQLVPLYVVTLHPMADVDQLKQISERCRQSFACESDDDVFVPLLQLDPMAVLQEMCEPAYLSAHLCDLLHVCGGGGMESALDLRHYLLMDYGNTLMAHSDLWEIGADYLCEVGPGGRAAVEQHLLALHVDGERVASKVWRLAKREKLDEAARMVVNTMTYRYVRSGCWAAAIGWALRGDGRRGQALDVACNAILFRASCDEVTRLSVLEQVGSAVVESAGLLFLYSYYEFSRMMANGEVEQAVQKLVSMLKSSCVPARFQSKLFEHLLEVLGTGDEIVLEKRIIYELMSLLKQVEADRTATHDSDAIPPTQLNTLRILLSRALARSIFKFR